MNGRMVIGPKDNLIGTIAQMLTVDRKDLSSFTVVFPGKRPAHFLRKALSLRLGGSFIPPKIFSVDDFIESLYTSLLSESIRKLETIDSVILLFNIHKEMKERLGGENFMSLDSFIPVGIKLFGELEELRMALLPENMLREHISVLTYNRLFTLPEYYIRFYRLISERKYSTRGSRYADVAGHIQNAFPDECSGLIIAAPFRQTGSERRIFEELSKNPKTSFIYQTDKTEEKTDTPDIRFIRTSDTHGQVFALSSIINDRIGHNVRIDENSVIVLPSSGTLFPLVNQTLSLLPPEDYNIALGYPVMRTPVYGFIENLMRLLVSRQGSRYSASHYLKFLLHPYTKNIRFGHRTDVTRILFHAVETDLTENGVKVSVDPAEIEGNDELFIKVAFAVSSPGAEILPEQLKEHLKSIHTRTLGCMERVGNLGQFAAAMIGLLTYIYEQSTARMHPLFQPFIETLMRSLMQIDNSIAGNESLEDTEGYFNFLRHYLSHQNVPFAGTPLKGLQVIGLLETRGLKFEKVFLLDANDNVLPGDPESDLLLPQPLREKLGLETRRDQDETAEYYFNLLVLGAKEVHIFFKESGDSIKSRFVEKLLWKKEKKDGIFSSDGDIMTVRYRVKLAGDIPGPATKSDLVKASLERFTYSASALDSYLRCQLRFYYKYILRLDPREEFVDEPDAREIGSIVHEILADFFRPTLGRPLEKKDLGIARLEGIMERIFRQKYGREHSGSIYLIKRQILGRLISLLTDYQEKMIYKFGIVINGIEEECSVDALGSRFTGKIDRVEKRGDLTVIIDYKTGPSFKKPPVDFDKLDINDRSSWTGAVSSLQLPLYLLLYSIRTNTAPEKIVPAFLFLGNNNFSADNEIGFIDDPAERKECFEKTKDLIKKMVGEINDQAIPFYPPSEPDKECPRCPFTTLCGTKWIRK